MKRHINDLLRISVLVLGLMAPVGCGEGIPDEGSIGHTGQEALSTLSPSLHGCPMFPADNAWNRDVSADPVDPNSANFIASMNGGTRFLHPDFGSDPSYGFPWITVTASQPLVPMSFTYSDESDSGPYPIPGSAPVEQGDQHVLALDSSNCHLYEIYNASFSGSKWDADSGAVFNLRSDALRPDGWTSADAAGLPILPGLVRLDEVNSGVISHALRFTVRHTRAAFVHPATHRTGSSTDPNRPPMGLRVRLKASFDLTPYHGAALTILKALKKYGMFVADNGSDWFISGETNRSWNDSDLGQLKHVPGNAFEVVKLGTVLTTN